MLFRVNAVGDDEAKRRAWFETHSKRLDLDSARANRDGGLYRCPCCHKRTLTERGSDDICPVCFWQDDGQDDHDADVCRGGPNSTLTLTEAREHYLRIGACEPRVLSDVRPPRPEED
jgi:hypothetical protein